MKLIVPSNSPIISGVEPIKQLYFMSEKDKKKNVVFFLFNDNPFFFGVIVGIYTIILYIHALNFKDFYSK